ncbi:MAG: hypothetical protein ACKPKO_38805 [Candidatus Fonsibacter sp.]
MKDIVAMYEKPENNLVKKLESQYAQTTDKRLRKVDTDELNLEALSDDLG